jgi:hypothetical protein
MNTAGSGISCGIQQLCGLGNAPTQQEYDNAVNHLNKDIMLIASVLKDQKVAIELLLKNGFKQVSDWKPNPNTKHIIALFMKRRENKTKCGRVIFDGCRECEADGA